MIFSNHSYFHYIGKSFLDRKHWATVRPHWNMVLLCLNDRTTGWYWKHTFLGEVRQTDTHEWKNVWMHPIILLSTLFCMNAQQSITLSVQRKYFWLIHPFADILVFIRQDCSQFVSLWVLKNNGHGFFVFAFSMIIESYILVLIVQQGVALALTIQRRDIYY